jgi:transketolase N-terminal domain/subunit
MKDEIIAEVWRNRDRLAAKYGHDLGAIVAAMQKRELHPLTKVVRGRKPTKRLQQSTSMRGR